jgi:hypothetical protein
MDTVFCKSPGAFWPTISRFEEVHMKPLAKIFVVSIFLILGGGQASGQFIWGRDPSTPVLSGGPVGAWNHEVMCPCVIYNGDSLRYEMWFSASSGTTPDWRPHYIGFATSPDRITWDIYPSAVLSPTPASWDGYTVELATVIREEGQYKMWYTSYVNVAPTYPGYIGYATSSDGVHWTKYPGNPVLGPGLSAWEAGGPYTCDVMPYQDGYKMWYAGWDLYSTYTSIGYATSSDGITWHRDTVHNPVMTRGAIGAWDHVQIFNPHIVELNSTYYMYYEGNSGSSGSIGCAWSTDLGITWTKYDANPVLSYSPGTWESSRLEAGSVLLRATKQELDMWYSGGDHNSVIQIGHALGIVPVRYEDQTDPRTFGLDQNYPNPFNPVSTIGFSIPESRFVTLKVYDILGREVAVLMNEKKPPGRYEVEFDGSGLSSGIYFYRLTAGQYVETRKMILMK